MRVHVISMSWSIEKISAKDAGDLQTAVERAIADGILLFCASDDQGNNRPDESETYPARCNPSAVFRIGAATRSGIQSEWVRRVDYILPGEKEQLIPSIGDQLSSHDARTASSLATALGSGIAALILHCAALNNKEDFQALRKWERMNNAFKNLCKSHQTANNYLHVREVFGKYLPKGGSDEDEQSRRAIADIVSYLMRE